jgi:hypothetical protein
MLLAQWAIDNNVGVPGLPSEVITRYVGLFPIMGHLHDANGPRPECVDEPCRKLAVCKALRELLRAIETPHAVAIRGLTQVLFDAVTPLEEYATAIELAVQNVEVNVAIWANDLCKEVHQIPDEERQRILELSNAAGLPPAMFQGILATLLQICGEPRDWACQLQAISHRLRQLEQEIRTGHLTAPRDHAPRQNQRTRGRPADELLNAVTQHLREGGFKPREIAKLIDAGDTKCSPKERGKHVSDRLDRSKGKLYRTKVVKSRGIKPGINS